MANAATVATIMLSNRNYNTFSAESAWRLPCSLVPRVENAYDPRENKMSASLAEVSRQDPSRLVLVVDDDKLARKAVVNQLNELGYETVEAASGFEAIRVAAVMKPGTVVVDGLLPNMHGFEVSRFIPAPEATY